MKILKKGKSYISIILLMVFCLISLNANGNNEKISTNNENEKVELNMAFWDSNQEPGLVQMANGFMESHPDITVKVQTLPWSQYWTKLQAAAMSKTMPDIVVMHPDEVENYVKGGALLDVTEQLEADGFDNFPDYVVNDFTVDGKIYGIPKDIGTIALYYNKDIFDAAGVKYPTNDWTWDDLKETAARLTNKSEDIYGFSAVNSGQELYWNLIWQNGGELFDEEGDNQFDSPEVIQAIEYAVEFIENGISPTASDFANLTQDEYFESGKLAMMNAGSWLINEFLNSGVNFGVAELPHEKAKVALCSGMAFSVTKSTKHQKAALEFIQYLGSQEANLIQAKSGVAIPARLDSQKPWIDQFTTFNATPFVDVAKYGHVSPGLTVNNEATAIVNQYMPLVFNLEMSPKEGCTLIAKNIRKMN